MSRTPSPWVQANRVISWSARERAREDEIDVTLAEHVRRAVADAGLRPRVSVAVEAEGVLVVVGALLGVADPELDVVPALERHLVGRGHGWIVLGGRLRSGDGDPGKPLSQTVAGLGGDLDGALGELRVAAAVADRDGIVRWQNARLTELAGDCVGHPLAEFVAPGEHARAAPAVLEEGARHGADDRLPIEHART